MIIKIKPSKHRVPISFIDDCCHPYQTPFQDNTHFSIFKYGKRHIVSEYWPVSRAKLLSHIESNNLLPLKEHGYCNKRSCLTKLLIARKHWTAAQYNGLSPGVLFIDFSKAFHKFSHLALIQKTSSFDWTDVVLECIRNFLCDRWQRVRASDVLFERRSVKSDVFNSTSEVSYFSSCASTSYIDSLIRPHYCLQMMSKSGEQYVVRVITCVYKLI